MLNGIFTFCAQLAFPVYFYFYQCCSTEPATQQLIQRHLKEKYFRSEALQVSLTYRNKLMYLNLFGRLGFGLVWLNLMAISISATEPHEVGC